MKTSRDPIKRLIWFPTHLSFPTWAGRPWVCRKLRCVPWFLLPLLAAPLPASDHGGRNLADLSIEELMNESVTSAAKKATNLKDSPTAITVITQDEIRQSGLQTIPDLLRLVPGVEVSQNGAHQWAVGIRGFSDAFANKVQVLVDGRTIYSTAVGGVHWDTHDMLFEDIDRIEVIRGPGATLWGANAVNGVISVITKAAKDTQGGLLTFNYGTSDQPATSVRYGGEVAKDVYYRVYAKSFSRTAAANADGTRADDAWAADQVGFRLDWEPSAENLFTLQGQMYSGRFHETSVTPRPQPPYNVIEHDMAHDDGANLLGRWTRRFGDAAQLNLQVYFDHATEIIDSEKEARDTFDFDLQQHVALGSRHDLVAGIGYRLTKDEFTTTPEFVVNPARRDQSLFSAFAQDSISLLKDQLTLTLGAKLEQTPFTGFEIQPSARLLWQPGERQVLWGAISRAVRTPTRLEHDGRVSTEAAPPATLFVDVGNPRLKSEQLIAYEFGYRLAPAKNLSFDLAAFYNGYDRLVGYERAPAFFEVSPLPAHTVEPSVAQNNVAGSNYGAELAARWQVTAQWRLSGGYSWLRSRFQPGFEEDNPQHQFFARTHVALTSRLDLDSVLHFFSRVPSNDVAAYTRWDAGLTWHLRPSLDVSLTGQNLFRARHREFEDDTAASVPRTVSGKITWRF